LIDKLINKIFINKILSACDLIDDTIFHHSSDVMTGLLVGHLR